MTPDDFRRLALSLPGAIESAHMGHPDFRRDGKIFATLWLEKGRGVVMLTPEQQEMLIAAEPAMFTPVNGAWGRSGSTYVELDAADEITVTSVLGMAWDKRAPKPRTARRRS